MKDTGKTINGVKVYSDPNVPPDTLYLVDKHFKLDKKAVKKYEKFSGFKTTGDVDVTISSDAMFEFYGKLIASPPERNGKLYEPPKGSNFWQKVKWFLKSR